MIIIIIVVWAESVGSADFFSTTGTAEISAAVCQNRRFYTAWRMTRQRERVNEAEPLHPIKTFKWNSPHMFDFRSKRLILAASQGNPRITSMSMKADLWLQISALCDPHMYLIGLDLSAFIWVFQWQVFYQSCNRYVSISVTTSTQRIEEFLFLLSESHLWALKYLRDEM